MRSVTRAAKALDEYFGNSDWVDRIDHRIDLRTDDDCVLGQVFGNAIIGIDAVRPITPFRTIFAFAPVPGFLGVTTRAWDAEIQLRRTRRAVAVMEADNIVAREHNRMLRDRVRKFQR